MSDLDSDSRYADGETLEYIKRLEAERDDYKARALMYERTNAEQAAMLNRVIAERDGLLAALGRVLLCDIAEVRTIPESCGAIQAARAAIAKVQP